MKFMIILLLFFLVILNFILTVVIFNLININIKNEDKEKKYFDYYKYVALWVDCLVKNKKLEDYFIENNYRNIAIYGFGAIGQALYDELKKSCVNVKYVIDKSDAVVKAYDVKLVKINDNFEEVDCIVVTPFSEFMEIEEKLYNKINAKILGINEIIEYRYLMEN